LPLDLSLGLLLGFLEAFFALSLATLIFSGRLNSALDVGISIALFVATVTLMITSLLSSTHAGIGAMQDGPNVIMALMVGSLASSVAFANENEMLVTVLAVMFISTLLTGIVFLAVGYFRLGGLVRYIPFPVVGGFLAGTGWLLVQGSFEILTELRLTVSNLPNLLTSEQIIRWLPALIFATVLLIALRKIQHFFTLPGLLICMLLIFYLVLSVTGISLDRASEMGLLLVSDTNIEWRIPDIREITGANFGAVFREAGNIGILIGISLIGMMLNTTSIELSIRKELDIDHELRVAGVTNILASFAAGMIGFVSVSLSNLAQRTRSRSRLPGIVGSIIVILIAWLGFSILAYLPRAVIGGMLLFLGFDFLNEWVIQAWKRFTTVEYGVIILIVVVIALTDFIIGVGVGLIAMIVMFAVSYSQISVVKHALSGAELQSNLERNAIEKRTLVKHGEAIYILELRGFLFFGTANSMLDMIRTRLRNPSKQRVRFILVDFMNVTGLDTSAILSFLKTEQLTRSENIILGLTRVSDDQLALLHLGGLVRDEDNVRVFPDMDRGLEWCEERILDATAVSGTSLNEGLRDQLCQLGFNENLVNRLIPYLQPVREIQRIPCITYRAVGSVCTWKGSREKKPVSGRSPKARQWVRWDSILNPNGLPRLLQKNQPLRCVSP
jgi:SulP family sulfate permease